MSRIIDLSKPVQFNPGDPFYMKVKVKHKPHRKAKNLIRLVVGLPARLFPSQWEGWADDRIEMGVHATTHLDAPWHYSPSVNGEPAKTIDQIPLDWCYGDGIVLDLSHKADFEEITVADLQNALAKTGATIQPGNIILIRTDRDRHMGTAQYPEVGMGVSKEATEWLIAQGVKVMGIDQWGWDLPLKYAAKEAKRTGNREFFWQGHLVGREQEYCHIEQLTNLKALPSHGFKVAVFPLRIVGASAAPARVVAILD